MSNEYTRLDPNQIIKREHDESTDAKRVKIVGTQMQIAISAEDNDSVQSVPRVAIHNLVDDQELDVTVYREIVVESNADMQYTINGVLWYAMTYTSGQKMDIMAKKIRFQGNATVMVRS